MNDRSKENKIYVDLATEFLHSLMLNASSIVSSTCKSEIIEFFLESVVIFNIRNSSI